MVTAIKGELLTETQAAEFLNFSKASLNRWRMHGIGPRFIKVSPRSIRYQKSDLLDWLADRSVQSTAEGKGKVS